MFYLTFRNALKFFFPAGSSNLLVYLIKGDFVKLRERNGVQRALLLGAVALKRPKLVTFFLSRGLDDEIILIYWRNAKEMSLFSLVSCFTHFN